MPALAGEARSALGEEIVLGGVRVRAGDLVVADRDGVLVLRDADVEALVAAIAVVHEREREIAAAVERGERLAGLLGIDTD